LSESSFVISPRYSGPDFSNFRRRLGWLALTCCRQFFALAEDKPCIARNDHRDVQRDAKPFAVAMRPCRANFGPDTTFLVTDLVALVDDVVKLMCRFVVHIFVI
jgi:hypothetical protein